ncbi:MAG: hypothetical protein ABR606_03050 [Vicinamibacterales bacterium]
MRRSLRRELNVLRAHAVVSGGALLFLAIAALGQPASPQKLGEISVERINVVDVNGTLRMVISNKDRMHPGVLDGKTIDRPRPVAGMLFFNDEGDEIGGLTYTGQETDGQRRATSGIAFDQLKQDQIIALTYSENNGERTAGLQLWDRPETRLSELIDKLNAANQIADATAREAAVKKVRSEAPPAPRRVFVGKNADRSAAVSLADANGKARLILKVDAGGEASIEFLDEDGKVAQRITGR